MPKRGSDGEPLHPRETESPCTASTYISPNFNNADNLPGSMMRAQDHLVFPASAASAADNPQDQPEVTPCIAELLRTRYNPPHLLLRVERVLEVPILFSGLGSTDTDTDTDTDTESRGGTRSTSGGNAKVEVEEEAGDAVENTREDDASSRPPRHRTFRIFLSDSELLIQALLKRELHSFVSMGEVVPGCVMRVESFELRWADRIGSTNSRPGTEGEGGEGGRGKGRIAFLAVERFRTVWVPPGNKGVERGVSVVKRKRGVKRRLENDDDDDDGGAAVESEGGTHRRLESGRGERRSVDARTDMDMREGNALDDGQSPRGSNMLEEGDDDDDDDDDADLHALLQTLSPPQKEAKQPPDESQLTQKHPPSPLPSLPITGNLVTLSSLLNPPHPFPRRNYTVSLLAIVCSISAHTRTPPPHTHLPLKRDLRIVDASIPSRSSGVHLSVFVDAANFFPRVGTVALFRGLKTHEWEGVSLNAFEGGCAAREWFVDDQRRLEGAGFDVGGLKEWWGKRCAEIEGRVA